MEYLHYSYSAIAGCHYVLLLVIWYMFSFSLSALSEKCPIEILLGCRFHTNQNCFHNTTSKTVVSLPYS